MLYFRRIVEDDLEKMMKWRTDDFITRHMHTDPVLDMEKQRKWFQKISNDPTCQHWIAVLDGVDIGTVNMYDINESHKRCFWGLYIADPEARGKRIARQMESNILDYGFFVMGLNKISAEMIEFNKLIVFASATDIEGVFKSHNYKDGSYHDVYRIAILKDKWAATRHLYDYESVYIEAPGT